MLIEGCILSWFFILRIFFNLFDDLLEDWVIFNFVWAVQIVAEYDFSEVIFLENRINDNIHAEI